MAQDIPLHVEFARVVGCKACDPELDRELLRDEFENVPQPGYIGKNYDRHRLLLVGQNPAVPSYLANQDKSYTSALRALRAEPIPTRYESLATILESFIPLWPVQGRYFPLTECGLALSGIAYCNIVRCRTVKNSPPSWRVSNRCGSEHFANWLELLAPRIVVFIGKYAADRGAPFVQARRIPHAFMNRQRSLSTTSRLQNRREVVAFVSRILGFGTDSSAGTSSLA